MIEDIFEFYNCKQQLSLNNYSYLGETFQKEYSKNSLNVNTDILEYWKNKKFKEIVNIEGKFFDNFMDSNLFEETNETLIFHVEFDLALFYFLINKLKKDLKLMLESIDQTFKNCLQEDGFYLIPAKIYETYFKGLNESSIIRKTIIDINRLDDFIIFRQDNYVLRRLYRIENHLEKLKEYKF